jgi:hypothetical protein
VGVCVCVLQLGSCNPAMQQAFGGSWKKRVSSVKPVWSAVCGPNCPTPAFASSAIGRHIPIAAPGAPVTARHDAGTPRHAHARQHSLAA